MTTGQRIAAKRKELNLSQESLGEQLGVSRQSIYKWESDLSLPEIDKLVAMSRLFGVPVGWLLGVEEPAADTPPSSPADSGELTQRQLEMVEEIVSRYLASQPKAKPRRRWPYVLAVGLLMFALFHLFDRLERLDDQYQNLSSSVRNITTDVSRQIGSITDRVEEVLKSQNELTADYDTQLLSADLKRNTVTFSVRVVPKTYVEGMEVLFLCDSGDGPAEFPSLPAPGNSFTGEITCELTDNITLSAVFVTGDTRQNQILDNYSGLYRGSIPSVYLNGLEAGLLHEEIRPDGTFLLPESFGWIRRIEAETKFGSVKISDIKVGLFKNFRFVSWLEPTEKPNNWDVDAEEFFRFPETSMALEDGDILFFAAIYTDEYGRQGVEASIPVFERQGDELSWTDGSDATAYFDIQNYKF